MSKLDTNGNEVITYTLTFKNYFGSFFVKVMYMLSFAFERWRNRLFQMLCCIFHSIVRPKQEFHFCIIHYNASYFLWNGKIIKMKNVNIIVRFKGHTCFFKQKLRKREKFSKIIWKTLYNSLISIYPLHNVSNLSEQNGIISFWN